MSIRSVQAPAAAVMVRPLHFASNPETARDNLFQRPHDLPSEVVAARATAEFDAAAEALRAHGVRLHVFEDTGFDTPNSVFPNNWFSTHHGGRIAIYPMFAPSRRRERRADVIEELKLKYRVQEVIDYSGLEQDHLFLEGTGAMVFDHVERVAYVGSSSRADPLILERFCTAFGYEPMVFQTADAAGRPIYHTNVLMAIGTQFALVALGTITDPARRAEVAERLTDSGRAVIDITLAQVADFCGNAMELSGSDGPLLAISTRAVAALRPDQRATIEGSAALVPLAIPTIELEGGSVRCMIAGIHLTPR